MKIALYQGSGVAAAPAENIEIIREAAAEAAAGGAELVIFPELFLTGYNLPDELRDLAETSDGPGAKRIADICRNYAIAVLYGYPETAEGLIWNSAQLFDRRGASCGNYRKVHLAPGFERDLFAAGDSFPAMSLGDLKLGALICYDVEFPELVLTYGGFIRSVETRVGPQRHRLGAMQWFPWPTRLNANPRCIRESESDDKEDNPECRFRSTSSSIIWIAGRVACA